MITYLGWHLQYHYQYQLAAAARLVLALYYAEVSVLLDLQLPQTKNNKKLYKSGRSFNNKKLAENYKYIENRNVRNQQSSTCKESEADDEMMDGGVSTFMVVIHNWSQKPTIWHTCGEKLRILKQLIEM